MFDSHWRVTLQQGDLISTYTVPVSPPCFRASDAEREARRLHALMAREEFPRAPWAPVRCLGVRHMREVLCRERALAWAALKSCGAIPVGGGWAGPTARGELNLRAVWRQELTEIHARYREHVIGFGRTLADLLTDLKDSPAGWNLAPYTYGDEVSWPDVYADITSAGTTDIWHTPYGVLWIDNG
ncbi:hypothetical protein [Streptomyces abikoensis]|uniref:Uncharacterized protein n=1 Tax=Streptomyces abikoensis TaxID=97398 RepID=A0ABW7T7K4_9ACTN